MATEDKRIDQLDQVSTLDLTSLMAMQQGTTAKKLTLEQLLNYLNAHVDAGNAVLFVAQTLTEAQKLQARTNIGAAAPGEGGGGGSVANAVLYVTQTLTDAQQIQARKNIRCGSVGEVSADCVASGSYVHAEGYSTKASGDYGSHAEGDNTQASGDYGSHAEGDNTSATGNHGSHAEGYFTTASGGAAHAEGVNNIASGQGAHAEGNKAEASGSSSHCEGTGCKAIGHNAHAEGNTTTAEADYSHAQGVGALAKGYNSHAEGYWTIAASRYQHVQGKVNIEDAYGKYAHIVGNGYLEGSIDDETQVRHPSNIHTLDWDGVPWFKGRAQCLGNAQDDGAKTVMLNGDTEITLTERTTGVKYNLYIDNGKLMMEVVS